MITTKAISAKIDADLLQELDEEVSAHFWEEEHHKTEHKERHRAYHASCGSMGDLDRQCTAEKYILDNMTDFEARKLDNIGKVLRLDRFGTIMRLIREGIDDFQRRPFSYL